MKPEIELFDSGDIALMQDLIRDARWLDRTWYLMARGEIRDFQTSPETVVYARGLLPPDAAIYRVRRRTMELPRCGAFLSFRRPREGRP